MVHVHVAYRIVGSPRIDKVVFPGHSEEDAEEAVWMDQGWGGHGGQRCPLLLWLPSMIVLTQSGIC
jgi:hypothetical protein